MNRWQIDLNANKELIKPAYNQWVYYAIGIVGGLISLFLWYASIVQADRNLSHIIGLQADHIANDIKIQFELRISALKHIANHLTEGHEVTSENWQADVTEFVNDYGEFKAIGLLDDSLKTLVLTPNLPDINESYEYVGSHYTKSLTALPKSIPWISPVIIHNSSKNIFIILPLNLKDSQKLVYLGGLVDINNLISFQLNHEDYVVTIYANDQVIYKDTDSFPSEKLKPAMAGFNISGNIWKVYVEPSKRLSNVIKTDLPSVAMILGITIAILFILTTHLAYLARNRAKSIQMIKEDLKMEIAERIEAQDSKQKLERELLQGQKLQAIGTLAGGIAHDFNNILYAINGYVEMTRDDVDKDSLAYINLGKVLDASQRGQELISRILAFSRRSPPELRILHIRSTIESVLALLKPTIPASVTINIVDKLSEDFTILGDQTRLHQIIVNLMNNAVDAMDGEGTVTIRLSIIDPNDPMLLELTDIKPKRYCKIEFSDTGHGMDHQTTARIFEPFFTTKEVGKGTGLGLATVLTTIKEHHGEIIVRSKLGQGTTFILLLPEYSLT